MSKSASKIRDGKSSVQKEFASLKNRRSVSVDTRARGSYVPEKKRPSSEERISGGNKLINRWGGARKSSINLTDAKRKDPRPLTDKAYQKRKANDLVQFLDESGFSPPITVAKMLSPSRKDFENIFQFLYKFFDPAYEVKKIEDEGPKILKNLNYPFTVNKSAFVYVARTNYPSLLGVLIWLMDLNKFAMKVDMRQVFDSGCDDPKAQIHRILLKYIIQCHHSGIDNEEEENVVFAHIVKSSMGDDIEELVAKNEEKKLHVASVEEKINKHKSLVEHSLRVDKNIEQFEDYISKMQSHYLKKKAVCEQLIEEKKQKETVLKALQEEASKKQDAYDAQGFDGKKHLSYFESQKKELSEKLERKRDIVKDLKEKCWEIEIKHNKNVTEVTEAVKSAGKLYNDIVELVSRVLDPLVNIKTPQVKNLFSNFQIDFPVWEIHFTKRNVESSEIFRSVVKDIVEKIKSTGENLKRVCASMHQKLSEIEMKKSEISTKLKLLSIQESKEEQELSSKKKIAVDEIFSLEAQCEKVTLAVKVLHEEKLKFEKIYRDMIQEKNLLIEFRERKEKDLQDFLIELKEMFTYFSENEEKAANLSEVYGNEISEKLEELNDL